MYEEEKKLNEVNAKIRADQLASGIAGQTLGGTLQGACGRASLIERITGQRRSAEQQGYRAGRLAELEMLLKKHPEVARILDLMDQMND